MFHIFTNYPYAKNEQCGLNDDWYTKENVENNVNIYINQQFNLTVSELYKEKNKPSLLELGCGSGSVISSFLEDDYLAVGLDGFYVYRKYLIDGWKKFPNNFFTCDIGEEFVLSYHPYARFSPTPFLFDVIFTTEFFEHLYPEQVNTSISNVVRHLKNNGVFIAEISYTKQGGHHTLLSRESWITKFNEYHLIYNPELTNLFHGKFLRNIASSHHFVFQKI